MLAMIHSTLADPPQVLVGRDYLPWGGDAVAEFEMLGAVVDEVPIEMLGYFELMEYCMVYLSAGQVVQGDPTHLDIMSVMDELEVFVAAGGLLFFETATESAFLTLPGGLENDHAVDWENFVDAPWHPIAASLPGMIWGSCYPISYDFFTFLPAGGLTITSSSYIPDALTTVEYPLGQGLVVATCVPGEMGLIGGPQEGCGDWVPMLWRNAAAYCLDYACQGTVDAEELPGSFSLGQNYPNPFNPATTIRCELERTMDVSLAVYDLLGSEVAVLHDGLMDAGRHELQFDASGLSSGIYFAVLEAEGRRLSSKMVLAR